MSRTIYERIFKRLIQLGIDPHNPPKYAKSRSKGFMDLNLTLLHKTTDCLEIALFHNFEQHGDLVPDPDMQIRVYPATKMAEALTYQDQFGYREVYPQPGKVNVAAKKDLYIFLNQWLKNCLEQGHSFRKADPPAGEAGERSDKALDAQAPATAPPQCEAAKSIRERYGAENALGYLVDEKLMNFAGARA